MSFFSSLFRHSEEEENQTEAPAPEPSGTLPDLYNGMALDLETPEGQYILTGRLSGYGQGDTTLTLERQTGALSLPVRDVGTTVVIRGISEAMSQFFLRGTIQESNRLMCRVKDAKVKAVTEHRQDFRLQLHMPVELYQRNDDGRDNPEECTLVDISSGGACIESEYLHAQDEVLRLRVKLMDYAPMEFIGEIIRVVEYQPGKFRYGFLFAQLGQRELTELTRTLYNIQVGNRSTWMRSESGHW